MIGEVKFDGVESWAGKMYYSIPYNTYPSEATTAPGAMVSAVEAATETSGNVWRKFAMNSSPGFCEEVLGA